MTTALRTRPAVVAGLFYPDAPGELAATVDALLRDAQPARPGPCPVALIAPHAGFAYSGPVAASAYRRVGEAESPIRRVVVVGPPHRVPVRGLAVSGADAFTTPLGEVTVDADARAAVLDHPDVHVDDRAHAPEHSIEAQLPFIQRVLPDRPLLPLLAGGVAPDALADVLARVWDGTTLVVVSTDLSHYYDLATARRLDRRTADAIVARNPSAIDDHDACGAPGVRGLLESALRYDLAVELIDLRTSGDTAGDPDRVVGYGAFTVSGTDR